MTKQKKQSQHYDNINNDNLQNDEVNNVNGEIANDEEQEEFETALNEILDENQEFLEQDIENIINDIPFNNVQVIDGHIRVPIDNNGNFTNFNIAIPDDSILNGSADIHMNANNDIYKVSFYGQIISSTGCVLLKDNLNHSTVSFTSDNPNSIAVNVGYYVIELKNSEYIKFPVIYSLQEDGTANLHLIQNAKANNINQTTIDVNQFDEEPVYRNVNLYDLLTDEEYQFNIADEVHNVIKFKKMQKEYQNKIDNDGLEQQYNNKHKDPHDDDKNGKGGDGFTSLANTNYQKITI